MTLPSFIKTTLLVLTTVTSSVVIYSVATTTPNTRNLNKTQAIDQIESRIDQYFKVERRTDTLYYPTLYKEENHHSSALIVDSLIKLQNGKGTIAVLRVFETTTYSQIWPYQSKDSTTRVALTELGSGRGYQVQMGLALFENESNSLDWLELDCGEFGEYFHLPSYTIHEFAEDMHLCWGNLILKNYSTLRGYGHIEITTIDLGGPNHLEITLRHITQSENVESYFGDECPIEMRKVEDEMEARLGIDLTVERFLEADAAYKFSERQLVITEQSSLRYADKVFTKEKGEFVADTLIPNPDKVFVYEQKFWPSGYMRVE